MDRRSFLASCLGIGACTMTADMPGTPRRIVAGSAPTYSGYSSDGLFTDLGEGLKIANARQWRLVDTELRNIMGAAVDFQGPSNWQDVGLVARCYLHDCFKGLYTHNGGEYASLVDSFISNCVFGVHVDSGNIGVRGCHIVYCSIGIKVGDNPIGANDAHGIVQGCMLNHCAYPIVCQNVTLGETFEGCHVIGGQGGADQALIEILNSKGIAFRGGQIAYCDVSVDATSILSLRDVVLRGPVNFNVAAGGILDSKNAIVMPGAAVTLNGSSWSGSN